MTENQKPDSEGRENLQDRNKNDRQPGIPTDIQNDRERLAAASEAATPSSELEEENERPGQKEEEKERKKEPVEALPRQKSTGKSEESPSGTTNLSLEQLKKEGGTSK